MVVEEENSLEKACEYCNQIAILFREERYHFYIEGLRNA